MQVDGVDKGKGIVEEQQDQQTSDHELEGMDDYGWVRAGSRRGRGGGRGRGRGPSGGPRRLDNNQRKDPGDTWADTKQKQAMTAGRSSRGGGRGGLNVGKFDLPRDLENFNSEGHLEKHISEETHPKPNAKLDMVVYERQAAVGDPSPSSMKLSLHLPVESPGSVMMLSPRDPEVDLRSGVGGSTSHMEDPPRLITSLDRDRSDQLPSEVEALNPEAHLEAHGRLVDRVSMVINSPVHRSQIQDHHMEEEFHCTMHSVKELLIMKLFFKLGIPILLGNLQRINGRAFLQTSGTTSNPSLSH
ncbi:hypothetical protein J5N97_018366 [Dioscorea zingiberensis]|uniref:Uncharacterized protein n=1 Tax=Dioscorea zingiberensis TaxID=325984 RepID=A0A9D5CMY6_9LILI|nr:hypothetical protein J5N97_018366 [Dioscorea zingiberensis]